MANFWGGCTPPRHSGTWVGARVASLRCHYPPPRRSQYSRNAEDRPHQSKTSCRGGHRRGTTTSGPGRGPLAGFAVTFYGRFSGDHRGCFVPNKKPASFLLAYRKIALRSCTDKGTRRCLPPLPITLITRFSKSTSSFVSPRSSDTRRPVSRMVSAAR